MTQPWTSHSHEASCAPTWTRCSKPNSPPVIFPPTEGVNVTCHPPHLSSFIKKCMVPESWQRTTYVWGTARPRRRGCPHIVFLGLDNSGKTSIIHSLVNVCADKGSIPDQGLPSLGSSVSPLNSPNTTTSSGSLPHAPPPTSQICKYHIRLGSLPHQEFIAVDMPGALSKRHLWLDALRHCDGVVFVVDSTDSLRFRVVRAELHRIMPYVQKKALPCLVMATKQDLFTAKSQEEILMSTSLSQMCAHLPAPWTLKPSCVLDTEDLVQAASWLLGHARELRNLVGDAAREKHLEYQARNLSYNLNKLQELQNASYIKATTWQ